MTADFDFGNLQSFGAAGFQPYPLADSAVTSPTSATSPSGPRGEKRKDAPLDLDGPASFAAEEDKRRRNTAASARFRVKKKQREQALEKTAKEMTDRATALEAKVNQLEMENKWLKGLITERDIGGEKSANVALGKSDLKELYEKFKSSSSENGQSPFSDDE